MNREVDVFIVIANVFVRVNPDDTFRNGVGTAKVKLIASVAQDDGLSGVGGEGFIDEASWEIFEIVNEVQDVVLL